MVLAPRECFEQEDHDVPTQKVQLENDATVFINYKLTKLKATIPPEKKPSGMPARKNVSPIELHKSPPPRNQAATKATLPADTHVPKRITTLETQPCLIISPA